MNLLTISYVLRIVGVLLILPSIFVDGFATMFPALDAGTLRINLFYAGVVCFASGALVFYIARNRKKPE